MRAAFLSVEGYPYYLDSQIVGNNNDSGAGSLRQAITDVGDGEEITFDDNYTITLTTGELAIKKNLTITGTGAGNTVIDGNNAFRVFNLISGTVTLQNMTIQNGNPTGRNRGAGIYNGSSATLTVDNCTISGNTTEVDGGGISNYGTIISLSNSTISDNTANYYGGGIHNTGTIISLSNNTISGNTATNSWGGGICNLYGTINAPFQQHHQGKHGKRLWWRNF